MSEIDDIIEQLIDLAGTVEYLGIGLNDLEVHLGNLQAEQTRLEERLILVENNWE